jgi:Zinc finger, C2H2 type/C2H2-type zinc finger
VSQIHQQFLQFAVFSKSLSSNCLRYQFNYILNRIMPIREDDSREEMVQCHTCYKSFASHERLRIHIKTVHSKEIQRNYECKECGKRFYRSVKLKEHIAVNHTREFPWSCSICGAGFRSESSWYFHKKTAHISIKFNFSESNEESVQNPTDIEIFAAQ